MTFHKSMIVTAVIVALLALTPTIGTAIGPAEQLGSARTPDGAVNQEANFKVVRNTIGLGWQREGFAMSREAGVYNYTTHQLDFTRLDPTIKAAARSGVKLAYGFDYYWLNGGWGGHSEPVTFYQWYNMGRALAERYRPNSSWWTSQGISNYGITFYGGFNEPDNSWDGASDGISGPRFIPPADYRNALKAYADGVHSVDPSLLVIPGGYTWKDGWSNDYIVAIKDLIQDGTIDGFDQHMYVGNWPWELDNFLGYGWSPQAVYQNYVNTNQLPVDTVFVCTETNIYADARASNWFFTYLWALCGVTTAQGNPATDVVMPFTLFSRPSENFLVESRSDSPWDGTEKGDSVQMISRLTSGMSYISMDPRRNFGGGWVGTGQYVLEGAGKKMWVWHNMANWTTFPGTSYTCSNIPAGTTRLEVFRYSSWMQAAGEAGTAAPYASIPITGQTSYTFTGLPTDETLVFLARVNQVDAPTFNLAGGSHNGPQSVSISAQSGASIRYTADGTIPTATSGILYSGPVVVSAPTTLNAVAYQSGKQASDLRSQRYAISGAFRIRNRTQPNAYLYEAGGQINYGSYSDTGAFRWTTEHIEGGGGAVRIKNTATGNYLHIENLVGDGNGGYKTQVSAISVGAWSSHWIQEESDGYVRFQSRWQSWGVYLHTANQTGFLQCGGGAAEGAASQWTFEEVSTVTSPGFSLAPGTYSSAQSIALTNPTAGATVRYTTDGSTPSATVGTIYSGPVNISTTTTFKAIAYKSGLITSTVTIGTYVIAIAARPRNIGANFARTAFSNGWGADFDNNGAGGFSLVGSQLGTSDWYASGTYTLRRSYTRAAGDSAAYTVTLTSDFNGTDTGGVPCRVGYKLDGGQETWSPMIYPSTYTSVASSITFTVPGNIQTLVVMRSMGGGGGYGMGRLSTWSDSFGSGAGGSSIVNGGVYELEPVCAPGKRLDVNGVSNADGANVQIWTDFSTGNQRWKAELQADGRYELTPQHALNKRLDVNGSSSAEGANVHSWTDNNSAAQRWSIMAQSDGTYELEPACAPGKRLDVNGSGSADGTNVHSWTDNNSAAQRWRFLLQ